MQKLHKISILGPLLVRPHAHHALTQSLLLLPAPEASSCRSAIRAAQAVVSDLGEEGVAKSKGLLDLSRCSEHHSERDVEVVTRRFQLQLPVRITELIKSPGVRYPGGFHVIALQSWLEFLITYNVWHVMLGLYQPDDNRQRAILSLFWKKYRALKPNHQVWAIFDKYKIDTSRCCPVILHGDEGRGRKKSPFLICSYHSFIGYGTHLANAKRTHRSYRAMRLNYAGSTHVHRMISACLPKMVRDHVALQDILTFLADSSLQALQEGIVGSDGHRYTMATLQVCGDWQWLAKCGSLNRTFANCPKRPLSEKSVPKGICHLCFAGRCGFPFEDLSNEAAWKSSMFSPGDEPFETRPALARLPHEPGKAAGLFAFDVWHGFHLGVAKTFCASAFAIISDRMVGGAIDARFQHLTNLYLQWCDEQHKVPFVTSITKESCGWGDRSTYPNGQWSKGHASTTFLGFLKWWLETEENNIRNDVMLMMCKEATECIDAAFEKLYASDVWLTVSDARYIGNNGLRFLQLYQALATEAYQNNLALWSFMPKVHLVHHIFDECASADCDIISPMTFAVQVDEDFIGRKARLARKVAPTQVILRTLQRSLAVSYAHWSESGFLK